MLSNLRLQGLEKKILIEAGETPAVVYEMKKQVDSFREKLEVRRKPSFFCWFEAASLKGPKFCKISITNLF